MYNISNNLISQFHVTNFQLITFVMLVKLVCSFLDPISLNYTIYNDVPLIQTLDIFITYIIYNDVPLIQRLIIFIFL